MTTIITPSKLSSISTTTLSQILQLTRSHHLSLTPSPSLLTSIRKNLITLRNGIDFLSSASSSSSSSAAGHAGEHDQVIKALAEQEERLIGLLEGLGIVLDGVGARGKQTGRLVDTGSEPELEQADDEEEEDLIVESGEGFPLRPIEKSGHITLDMASEIDRMEEDEQEMNRANNQVMQMQRQMIDDQDQTLSSLSSAISRQHALSLNISSELELHEDLLEDTDQAIDRTANRLRRAGSQLSTVSRRARDTGSTGLIILLVVILVVLLVAFR